MIAYSLFGLFLDYGYYWDIHECGSPSADAACGFISNQIVQLVVAALAGAVLVAGCIYYAPRRRRLALIVVLGFLIILGLLFAYSSIPFASTPA